MPLTPNEVRYGQAVLNIAGGVGSSRTITATHAAGTVWPNAHVESTSVTFNITQSASGVSPPTGVYGFALVEDAADVSGNYTTAGGALEPNVLAFVGTFAAGSLPASITFTGVNKGGTYRCVIVGGDNDARARRNASVDTSGGSSQWHADGDGYFSRGGLANATGINNAVLGAAGHRVVNTARTPTAGNWRLPQQNQIAISIRPAGNTSAALINPKQIKLAISQSSGNGAIAAGQGKLYRNAPNTTGDFTRASIPVDTDFTETLGGVLHHIQLGVNGIFGDTNTPAAEQADLYNIAGATITGVTASQRSAFLFASAGHVADTTFESQNRVRTTTAPIRATAAVQAFKNAGLSTGGVNTHNGSGRTNINRYFHRRQSATLTGPHGAVFLQVWLADGYGNALNNVNFTMACLDSDGSVEDSQSATTSSAGLIQWNYTILPTHKAFNAFRRSGFDNPDSLGVHDIAIPTADVFKPAGTKTGDYPDPKNPSMTRSYSAASFLARAKDVRATSAVYAEKNPSVTVIDVYGVHSEMIFGGAASVNTSDRTTDANGVPTGPIVRSKPTTAGGYALKLTDVVNETTFAVDNPSRQNATDRAGRPYAYTGGFEFLGRRAVKDRTFGINNDLGTSLPTQENLEGPLGYSIHGTPSQTFNLLAAPSDATNFGYYQGFSNLSATRDSFGLDSGAGEVPGFTIDSGLFGYKLQVLQFKVIRDDLVAPLEVNPTTVYPGQQVRFKAKAYQILPDKTMVPKEFDSAPVLYISEENDAGNPSAIVATITMTPIGALPTGDYEATYTPPTPVAGERQAYGIVGFAAIQGSSVQLSTRQFTTGSQNPDVSLYIDVGHAAGGPSGAHLTDGDDLRIEVGAGNLVTGDGVALDNSTVRVYIFSTDESTGTRFFNDPADQQWKGVVAEGGATPYVPQVNGEVFDIVISGIPIDRDMRFVAYAQIDGVTYKQRETREIVGTQNRHDRLTPRLAPFIGDFDLEGRHWIPGDSFTITALALLNDNGTLVSEPPLTNVVSYAITAVNQGTKTFTVSGDVTADLFVGAVLTVSGSTGNNGNYKVTAFALNGGNTDITVLETIPNATPDGALDNDLKIPTAIIITGDGRDLKADGTISATTGPIVAHGLPGGTYVWGSAITKSWPKVPLYVFITAIIGDPNGNDTFIEANEVFYIVGKKNRHDKYAFDAVGFASQNRVPFK